VWGATCAPAPSCTCCHSITQQTVLLLHDTWVLLTAHCLGVLTCQVRTPLWLELGP
jgi:hypothetical protein